MVDKHKRRPVIIYDHQFLSDLFWVLLKDHRFELVNSIADSEIGLSHILTNPLDLVIIDAILPIMCTRGNGKGDIYHRYILVDTKTSFRTLYQKHTAAPNIKILILTGERHPYTFYLGFEARAHGIARKLDDLPTSFFEFQILVPSRMDLKALRLASCLHFRRNDQIAKNEVER